MLLFLLCVWCFMYLSVKTNISFIFLKAVNTKMSAGVCKEMLVRETWSFLLLKLNIQGLICVSVFNKISNKVLVFIWNVSKIQWVRIWLENHIMLWLWGVLMFFLLDGIIFYIQCVCTEIKLYWAKNYWPFGTLFCVHIVVSCILFENLKLNWLDICCLERHISLYRRSRPKTIHATRTVLNYGSESFYKSFSVCFVKLFSFIIGAVQE